jgi:hypothetical protein
MSSVSSSELLEERLPFATAILPVNDYVPSDPAISAIGFCGRTLSFFRSVFKL